MGIHLKTVVIPNSLLVTRRMKGMVDPGPIGVVLVEEMVEVMGRRCRSDGDSAVTE